MALQKTKFSNNSDLFVLKLKTKDASSKNVPPHFEVSKRGEDGKYSVVNTTDFVSGNLVKVEIKEREWEGDKYNTVNVYLADGKDLYLLDLRFTMLGRSLFNSLLSLTSFNNLSISTYMAKDKKDEAKEYPRVSLRQNDETVSWKYGLDELPKPESITFKGKTMNDFSSLDNMFVEKLEEFAKLVNGNKTIASKASDEKETAKEPNSPAVTSKETVNDDIPF